MRGAAASAEQVLNLCMEAEVLLERLRDPPRGVNLNPERVQEARRVLKRILNSAADELEYRVEFAEAIAQVGTGRSLACRAIYG